MINVYPTNGMNAVTGYGRVELGIIRALHRRGINPTLWGNPAYPTLVIGNPLWHIAPHIENHRLWSFTMNETDRVGEAWVEALNEHYELVLVPAKPMVEIFKASGVIIPVHFVPLGIDWYPPTYKKRDFNYPFTFLTYSLGDMRKGAHMAMLAFDRLFKGDERFRMIIKARDNWRKSWLVGLQNEQISLVGGQLTDDEWHDLLYRCHAFIFPSRGEGYGLPPREAVLSGLPTIATQWLGMWDADEWGLPLSVDKMRPAQFDFYEANAEGSLWAVPSETDLDKHMQWIVDNYQEALALAARGNMYLRSSNTWERVVDFILDLVQEKVS